MKKRLIVVHIRAFSLTEVCLALGIAAFCLVALFGLLPVGLNSNQASVEQTMAAGVITNVVADLQSTKPQSVSSPALQIPLPQATVFGTAGALTGKPMTAPGYLLTRSFFARDDGTPVGPIKENQADYDAAASVNQPRYRVTVDLFQVPNQQAVAARIRVSWPPMVKLEVPPALHSSVATRPSGVVEMMTSINRNL